jgi:hypothetical protein
MIMRTNRKTLKFIHPFFLKGIDRTLPPGEYQVVTDEELIEGLSFPVYRRVSTMIFVPSQFQPAASVEMVRRRWTRTARSIGSSRPRHADPAYAGSRTRRGDMIFSLASECLPVDMRECFF